MRKTKIICTLGPTTDKEGILEDILRAGMDAARMNFSHGTYEQHDYRIKMVRELSRKYGKDTAIILDTKGPEIRTKEFENGKVKLNAGQEFVLHCEDVIGNENGVGITYANLYNEVEPGMNIMVNDGLIEMTVIKICDKKIHCVVKNDCVIAGHKGINIPEVHIAMPYLSEIDKEDIMFGIEHNVEYIAASFVRRADDVRMLRRFLDENGGSDIEVIAKIENREGVDNIDEIIKYSEGIMIARGDMGVELPVEEVPSIQKMIIGKVLQTGKLVITATQMLESMVSNKMPTRAEACDVANAIYDGTGAIMLSGETAAGEFPVEAVEMMVKLAVKTEADIDYKKRFFSIDKMKEMDTTDAICHATCTTAYDLDARSIITVTKSGKSAIMVSKYRPGCRVIAGSMDERICRKLNLYWGITPIRIREKQDVFGLFNHAVEVAKKLNLIEENDLVVITSGIPLGISGTTNMIKVHMVD